MTENVNSDTEGIAKTGGAGNVWRVVLHFQGDALWSFGKKCGTRNATVVWGLFGRASPGMIEESHPEDDSGCAKSIRLGGALRHENQDRTMRGYLLSLVLSAAYENPAITIRSRKLEP